MLKRQQQWLKKTGQFSYVMAVELVHIYGEKFEFVFTVLISQRYREMSDITGFISPMGLLHRGTKKTD